MSPGAGMTTSSCTAAARARKTRRIGCAKLLPEYWVSGLGSGKPQSQGGARRIGGEAKRWMVHTASIADVAMNRNTSRPLYELPLATAGTIVSQGWLDCSGSAPPVASRVIGATASMKKPGTTPVIRKSKANNAIADSEKWSTSAALAP